MPQKLTIAICFTSVALESEYQSPFVLPQWLELEISKSIHLTLVILVKVSTPHPIGQARDNL